MSKHILPGPGMYVVLAPFAEPNRRMYRTILSVTRGLRSRLTIKLNDGHSYEFEPGGASGNGVTEPCEYLPEGWVCIDSDFDGEIKCGPNIVSGNPTPEGFASHSAYEVACAQGAADDAMEGGE